MRSSLRVHAPALSLLLVSLPGLAAAQAARADTHPDPQEMHIALTGDSIINRRLSVYDDAATVKLFDALRRNEVVFTNFETLIHPDTDPGAAVSGGAYQSSPAWTADELKWAGFNLLSVANNHAFDFGMQGMLSNLKALDEAGLTYAGAGENLARARGAGYLDTRRGRVALIALASTFTEGSFASEQRPDLAGRPGIDPLRVTTRYTVDPATFDDLKRLSAAQGSGEGGAGPRNAVRIGTLRFQAGEKDSVITEADPADVKGLLESIKNAHRQADWVIVSSHTHETAPGKRDVPPDFLVSFAHAAIDAGADVFVSHGPHVLRGIEIYKGKPIFYSLGNFVFENETMLFQPAESYDSLKLPPTASVGDYFDTRSGNDTKGFPVDKQYWESMVAEVSFSGAHTLDKIKLTPITLGFREPRPDRGQPRLAGPEVAKEVLDNVAKLSELFGTKIRIENNEGYVVVRLDKKD